MLITGTAVYTSTKPFAAAGPAVFILHPAARHKTAPASRGVTLTDHLVTLVSEAGRISSVMTLTAALRK